jgi:hypothetical protein
MFIYIPIIDNELKAFTTMWNNHRIRKDGKRPRHVNGVPNALFEFPPDGVDDWAEPFDYDCIEHLYSFLDQFSKWQSNKKQKRGLTRFT